MLISCDRTATKNAIRDALLEMAANKDYPLSKSRADSLADKFKRGAFDPELAYVLDYWDETGEIATENVDNERNAA